MRALEPSKKKKKRIERALEKKERMRAYYFIKMRKKIKKKGDRDKIKERG